MPQKPAEATLKKLYSKLLGERERFKAPPKKDFRLKSDREAYAAAASERAARLAYIAEALPHLEYVIMMFDEGWSAHEAKPTRPSVKLPGTPPEGFASAAMAVLWLAEEPLTIIEIAHRIADKQSFPLDSGPVRRRYHTAINNSLMQSRDQLVLYDETYPNRWALKSRGLGKTI